MAQRRAEKTLQQQSTESSASPTGTELSSVTTEPNTRQSDPVNSFSLAQLTNSFSPLPYTQQTRVCSIFFGPESQYFVFAAVYLIFWVSFGMISSVTTLFPSANLKIIRPCPNPVTLTCPVPKHFTEGPIGEPASHCTFRDVNPQVDPTMV